MEWHDVVEQVKPHIVSISTPNGSGTGFHLRQSQHQPLAAVATAAHVVREADRWEQPIRIEHPVSGSAALLRVGERAMFFHPLLDTAVILFNPQISSLTLPPAPLALIPSGKQVNVGVELGWLGFPAVYSSKPCFFSGRVSAHHVAEAQQPTLHAYLVDGVAINGVSGGPAFFPTQIADDGPMTVLIVGVVSAYLPNIQGGHSLPGLALIQDVAQLQAHAQRFQTLDDAAHAAEAQKNQASSTEPIVAIAPSDLPLAGSMEPTTGGSDKGSIPR